ncbi:hypothetical protein EF847_04690 [Actinobacteria bacterium YIM 96077]|uniref:Uncharacterized protein n=1 Tax=Phytoactinopolyspora halophila TaxID=1981511 RepID=A0A329R1Z9_9ACTN|nr:hypothetical protein [Phytoactinopolyspora halophila]AYY12109.1 hypothetical protein EF847_04690 [Actinobacteria bacterium YIM 96077]RAW18655.1 hypothetical protein DPM12_00825 [Phytoactinopolyspora halophila]
MFLLTLVTFAVAWWLGLYLLANAEGRPAMWRAAWGLLVYAVVLGLAAFDGALVEHVDEILAGLPALIWTGVLVALLGPGSRHRDAAELVWRWAIVPVGILVLVTVSVLDSSGWRVAGAAAVVLPLLAALVVLLRDRGGVRLRDGLVVIASLLFALGVAALVIPFDLLPDVLVLAGIGLDLVVLGAVVAVSTAMDVGQVLRLELARSVLSAGIVALVFGVQVGLVVWSSEPDDAGRMLVFGTVGTAIAVVTLASPLQGLLDRLVFGRRAGLRTQRSQLRDAVDALPRRDEHQQLAELDGDALARLVREALRHYGDLGKLVSNPLVMLPSVDARLDVREDGDHSLDRAVELKAILHESVERLKPRGQEFGTSDEWRHFNALYYPYIVGIRPYRRQPDLSGLDANARAAFDWFRRYVPERTLYNWQHAAVRVVAMDLRARNWQ